VPKKANEVDNQVDESMWNLWKKDNISLKKKLEWASISASEQHRAIIEKEGIASTRTAQSAFRFYKSFDKLSWATAGYHYDWTARSYNEHMKSPVPPVMSALGSLFAELDPSLSPPSRGQGFAHENKFMTSASIVNYYSLRSKMGGHRDDLELDFTKPVVSISLGLPAVFLLGSKMKEEEPVIGILVRPGDVMLLAGDSRLCFHGMARVIPNEVILPRVLLKENMAMDRDGDFQIGSWSDECLEVKGDTANQSSLLRDLTTPDIDVDAVRKFLSSHRININLRQVLPYGVDEIPSKEDIHSA